MTTPQHDEERAGGRTAEELAAEFAKLKAQAEQDIRDLNHGRKPIPSFAHRMAKFLGLLTDPNK